MDRSQNNDPVERDPTNNRLESRSSIPGDLPDSPRDQEELRSEETYIDLPDVKDIPGQEFVNTPSAGALRDTTISSDDEEGRGVFDLDDSEDLNAGTQFDVTADERRTLEDDEYLPTTDENNLRRARMDDSDFQGEGLNEASFGDEDTGEDLDVPGTTDETTTSAMGEGDEENKYYSLGSADNDNVTEGTP
ncbi:MAG TPA: hypothetical protein VNS32_07245 [Flavisolibacter sp.]|nr:hypothetical protein [Flavisolibacter sp.]